MTPISNEFQEYSFNSDTDELNAFVFNPLQLAALSNRRASVARALINSPGTTKDYNDYVEITVHLKGQLDVLDQLLAQHEQSVQQLSQIQE